MTRERFVTIPQTTPLQLIRGHTGVSSRNCCSASLYFRARAMLTNWYVAEHFWYHVGGCSCRMRGRKALFRHTCSWWTRTYIHPIAHSDSRTLPLHVNIPLTLYVRWRSLGSREHQQRKRWTAWTITWQSSISQKSRITHGRKSSKIELHRTAWTSSATWSHITQPNALHLFRHAHITIMTNFEIQIRCCQMDDPCQPVYCSTLLLKKFVQPAICTTN